MNVDFTGYDPKKPNVDVGVDTSEWEHADKTAVDHAGDASSEFMARGAQAVDDTLIDVVTPMADMYDAYADTSEEKFGLEKNTSNSILAVPAAITTLATDIGGLVTGGLGALHAMIPKRDQWGIIQEGTGGEAGLREGAERIEKVNEFVHTYRSKAREAMQIPKNPQADALVGLVMTPITAAVGVGEFAGDEITRLNPESQAVATVAGLVSAVPEGMLMLAGGHGKKGKTSKSKTSKRKQKKIEKDQKAFTETLKKDAETAKEFGIDFEKEIGIKIDEVPHVSKATLEGLMEKAAERRKIQMESEKASQVQPVPPEVQPMPIPGEPGYTKSLTENFRAEKPAPVQAKAEPVAKPAEAAKPEGAKSAVDIAAELLETPEMLEIFAKTKPEIAEALATTKRLDETRAIQKERDAKAQAELDALNKQKEKPVEEIPSEVAEQVKVLEEKPVKELPKDEPIKTKFTEPELEIWELTEAQAKLENRDVSKYREQVEAAIKDPEVHVPAHVVNAFEASKEAVKVEAPKSRRKKIVDKRREAKVEAYPEKLGVEDSVTQVMKDKKRNDKEGVPVEYVKEKYPEVHEALSKYPGYDKVKSLSNEMLSERLRAQYGKMPRYKVGLEKLIKDNKALEKFQAEHYSPREVKNRGKVEIDNGVMRGVFTEAEGKVLHIINDTLKHNTDVTWIKGLGDYFTGSKNQITLKNFASAPHELGHWAFHNVLSGKDRIAFLEMMKDTYGKKGKDMNDYLAVKSYMEDSKTGKKYTSNHRDNFGEYFAEQFAQYIQFDVLPKPAYKTLMDKVVGFFRELYDKGRKENLYDRDLQVFFDKIVDREKVMELKKEKTKEVAKAELGEAPLDLNAMLSELVKEEKINEARRRKKKTEDAKLLDELERENLNADPDLFFESFDDMFKKTEEVPSYQSIFDKFKEKIKKQGLDRTVAREAAEHAPKEMKGYSKEEVAHYNEMLHTSHDRGIPFQEVYERMGIEAETARHFAEGAEHYAKLVKDKHESIHGKQVNAVWKNKKKEIYNTPVYRKEMETLATLVAKDYKQGKLGDWFITPESFFDKLGPELREVLQGPLRDAQHALGIEQINASKRVGHLRKLVKRKDRKALDNFTFAQQRFGKEYLASIKEKAPKWEELSPGAQVAYVYMRNEFKNYFNRLNMMRKMNGLSPFKETANYFTFMTDLQAFAETGKNILEIAPDKFAEYQTSRSHTKFRYTKRKKLEMSDGTYVRMEHDAFKRFEIYQQHALRHIHMTPALKKLDGLMKTKIKLDQGKHRAGDLADPKVKKRIEKGTLKADTLIPRTESFSLGSRNPDVYAFLDTWKNDVALGRERMFGEFEKGGVDGHRVLNYALRTINENLAHSALAGSVRLVAMQPAALTNTITVAGRHLPGGIAKSFSPKHRKFAIKESKHLAGRLMDAHVGTLTDILFSNKTILGKARGVQRATSRGLFALTRLVDREIALQSWHTFYDKAKSDRLKHHEAVRFADSSTIKTQSSGLLMDRAKIQRNIGGKTLMLFQTFTISQYNLLRHDIISGGGKKSSGKIKVDTPELKAELIEVQREMRRMAEELNIDPKRITHKQSVMMAAKFMAGTILVNALFEDLLGVNAPNPTPIRSGMEKYESTGEMDKAILASTKEMAGYIPGFGGLTYGSGPGGAAYENITRLLTAPSLESAIEQGLNLAGAPLTPVKVAKKAYDEDHEWWHYFIRKKRD